MSYFMPTEYTLEKFSSGMHYIMLDAKTVKAITKNGNKRAICLLNGLESIHCAIMPKKEGGHYINIGAAVCKKLKIKVGAIVTAKFTIDQSTYQFEMPEEFAEVLAADPEANQVFHALTEGNQRGLIYLVSKLKSIDKRIDKALAIAEKIKRGIISPRNI
jgi:Bacteriocin-protection, YdeI or OmpD-Associated/Domain of unknown function (DUF1905)